MSIVIAIVDYGMGNLRSVWKAFKHLGTDARLTRNPRDIASAEKVVLPGVGAFRDCMTNLAHFGLIDPILMAIGSGKPYLGICLGLQILFEESEEFGQTPGLGVLRGKVVRFSSDMPARGSGEGPSLKVPHIGWNSLRVVREAPVLDGIAPGAHCYFVHSYFGQPEDPQWVATCTTYGIEFASSVWKDNVFACQFHPEKSQAVGLKLLENFIRLT
jgi:imidazole glycerol-phosphate synthase subunit HisH